MARRLRIGLTGGIASGKSTVAQRFLELAVPVIDADESARRVVAPHTAGLKEVVQLFGDSLLTLGGELDRRKLRDMIFSEPKLRRQLESILHPLILADMERQVKLSIGPYIVMAIPLLIETGDLDRVDRILVVDVPEDIQMARVIARDAETVQRAQAILAAQATRAARLKAADDILANAGTRGELRKAVDALHQVYLRLAATTSP